MPTNADVQSNILASLQAELSESAADAQQSDCDCRIVGRSEQSQYINNSRHCAAGTAQVDHHGCGIDPERREAECGSESGSASRDDFRFWSGARKSLPLAVTTPRMGDRAATRPHGRRPNFHSGPHGQHHLADPLPLLELSS